MGHSPVILIFGRDQTDQEKIKQQLSGSGLSDGWQLVCVPNDLTAHEAFEKFHPHLMVMSFECVQGDAVSWVLNFSKQYPDQFTPILVLTDNDEQAETVASLHYELCEFFPVSNHSALHMCQVAKRQMEMSDLLIQSTKQTHQLAYQVNTDFLTGLNSRSALEFELQHVLDRHVKAAADGVFAVLMIDLDDFKEVNGTLGHVIGDLLLKQTSERLALTVRESDFLARSGGDEFVIIMSQLNSTLAAGLKAEELVKLFEKPFNIKEHEVRISVSVGVVCYPAAGTSVAELMSHVDIAMYRAKKEGGNGWRYYTDSVNKAFYADLRLENAMRLAIQNDELFLMYQPQFHIESQVFCSAEVLLRWDRPEVGIVSPDEFIPLAEKSGMIHALGFWLIENVFKKIQSGNFSNIKLVINLSARQLEAEGFADEVKLLIDKYQVTPDQFSFELTESALLLGSSIEKNLFDLADAGIKFAIDDFGTGYSSLSYLRKLPVDTIKIDRSFIADVMRDENDAKLVRSILAMAKNLDLRVIAEGIETEEQVEFFKQHQCDLLQGFYYSRPLQADDLLVLISQS